MARKKPITTVPFAQSVALAEFATKALVAAEQMGFLVDARVLKREFQEEALRKGLIPYIPERPKPVNNDDEVDHEE